MNGLEAEATPEQLMFQAEVDEAIGHESQIIELTSERMVFRYRTTRVEFLRVFCKLEDELWQVDDYIALGSKRFWCAITQRGLRATCP